MVSQQRIFFDFLQFCIGSVAEIPASVKDADWKVLYAIAKKQALIGVLFHGIKQLPKELAPDADLLMQWMGMAQNPKAAEYSAAFGFCQGVQELSARGIPLLRLEGTGKCVAISRPLHAYSWGYRHLSRRWQKASDGICQ